MKGQTYKINVFVFLPSRNLRISSRIRAWHLHGDADQVAFGSSESLELEPKATF